jgi:spore germination protein
MMKNTYRFAIFGICLSLMLLNVHLMPVCTSKPLNSGFAYDNGGWVAYWDYENGMKEFNKVYTQLNSVSYFAVSFDEKFKLVLPDKCQEFSKKVAQRRTVKKYLTVVNDVLKANGGAIPKDRGILEHVWESEESTTAHVQDLLRQVKGNGYDGLEVDYEAFWQNSMLVRKYERFLEILWNQAQSRKIPLRVILEPSVPFNTVKLPQGPEYVVMCYNLYGTHSSSGGPKADKVFLERTLSRMSMVPEPRAVALATGGCLWQSNKKPRFVNEEEALQLEKKLKVEAKRDVSSQALYFLAEDEKGNTLECWYADAQTINFWKRRSLDYNVDGISIWRFGGNKDVNSFYPGLMTN